MRFIFLAIAAFVLVSGHAQPIRSTILSGVVIDMDSIGVTDAAIINARSGKTVRTNSEGFFQTEIAGDDSLLIYHIAYKRKFITEKDNARKIVLEPEIQELMQIDVSDKKEMEQKNLKETVDEIKRLGPMKKLEGYDLKSRQSVFVDEHGTHNKGFSPFFGPTVRIPIGKIGEIISERQKKKQLKKMTEHYHVAKRKK